MTDETQHEEEIPYEFVSIPNFPGYQIRPDSLVREEATGEILTSYCLEGYRKVTLTKPDGEKVMTGVHRLMALAFLEVPENYRELVVNHRNGLRSDNRIENLEWCTQQFNCQHAGYTGLSEKSKPIQVRNIDTGEVSTYITFIDFAERYGISKDAVSWRVNAGPTKVDNLGNQYRLYNRFCPDAPWPEPDYWGRGRTLVRDALTHKVLEFYCQEAVCRYFKYTKGCISEWLADETQPVVRMGDSLYQMIPYSPNPKWIDYENPYLAYESAGGYRCVVMYHPEHEEPRIWLNLSEAGRNYGYGKHIPYWRCQHHKLTPWKDGLICHYLNY